MEETAPAEAEYARAQAELEQIQNELIERDLEMDRQSATLEALAAAYPALEDVDAILARNDAGALPTTVVLTHLNLYIKIERLRGELESLEAESTALASQIEETAPLLAAARQAATQRYARASNRFEQIKQWCTLSLATICTGVVFLVVWVILQSISRSEESEEPMFNPKIMWGSAIVVTILFVYQAFGAIGVALIATILLVTGLPLLSRQVQLTQRRGDSSERNQVEKI
jgi:hypothetical protein